MILTKEQRKAYIDNPQNAHLTTARKKHYELNMLVNGVGTTDYLEKIDGYENDQQKELRHKFAKSSKHIFSSMLRNVDKIYSATGGQKVYDLPDSKMQGLYELINSTSKGLTVTKWVQNVLQNKYITDPNGLCLIEWNKEGAYPTYKASTCIYDYASDGQDLEYIIFEPEVINDKKYYRIIDDVLDALVDEQGEVVEEMNGKAVTFENPFKRVPAFIISDLCDNVYQIQRSPIDEAIELGLAYVHGDSIHSIYTAKNSFPITWMYERGCKRCDGTGLYDGKTCSLCDGTGISTKRDVSDIISVKVPQGDDPILAPNLAGFIQTDISTWQEQRVELDWIEEKLYKCIWNVKDVTAAEAETATAAFIDVQPVVDRLNAFSDWAEVTEKRIVDFIAWFQFRDVYKGSSIKYGRRYLIESPDAIMTQLVSAKEAQLPSNIIWHKTDQYISVEFANDEIMKTIQYKLLQLEPFPFFTIEQVQSFRVPDLDKLKKIYFNDWVASKAELDLYVTPYDKLKADLDTFVEEKFNQLPKINETTTT